MWSIRAQDIISLGRTSSGQEFTELVDAILRAVCYPISIPDAHIHTNHRVNKQDGGVDTEFESGCTADSTGYLTTKSIWQYKATEGSDVAEGDLRTEARKWYAQERLGLGYIYRFCICDEVAGYKKTQYRDWLLDEINKKHPSITDVKVLCASDLASLASRYVGVAQRFFRKAQIPIQSFDGWQATITRDVPDYHPIDLWKPIHEAIDEHIDFSKTPRSAAIRVSGDAGVGKTRMVFESLRTPTSAKNLVGYTCTIEAAKRAVTHICNASEQQAILVVDECLQSEIHELNQIANGHVEKVRLVCISNTLDTPSLDRRLRLKKMDSDSTSKILEQNFPGVPQENRSKYAGLSDGFIRLAAAMCNDHAQIQVNGAEHIINALDEYYLLRVADQADRKIVEALSLFHRVGFKNELRDTELDEFCQLFGFEAQEVTDVAQRMHEAPGFVQTAGRYLYVTPQIISDIAHRRAWDRWVSLEGEKRFFDRIPETLFKAFDERLKNCNNVEAAKSFGDFFFETIVKSDPIDLANPAFSQRLVHLCRIDPDRFFPLLRVLTEGSNEDEILAAECGRRGIVWLCEALAAFPEHFVDAEKVLFKLALHETENSIGNNATEIWSQLYGVFLSGTAVPFAERFPILRQRYSNGDEEAAKLVFNAVRRAMNRRPVRMGRSLFVAGKTTPEDWRPRDVQSLSDCQKLIQSLLVHLIEAPKAKPELAKLITNLAHDLALDNGLDVIQNAFKSDLLTDEKAEILNTLEHLTSRLEEEETETRASIEVFLDRNTPDDFDSRLRKEIALDQWRTFDTDKREPWLNAVKNLAEEMDDSPELISSNLNWLTSPSAKNAFTLGYHLAKCKSAPKHLALIVESAINGTNASVLRGYVSGMIENSIGVDELKKTITNVKAGNPELAYEIAVEAGDLVNATHLVTDLVRNSKLGPRYLRTFEIGVGPQRRLLTIGEFTEIGSLLIELSENEVPAAQETALKFLYMRQLLEKDREVDTKVTGNSEAYETAWQICELPYERLGIDTNSLLTNLAWLAPGDIERATKILFNSLSKHVYTTHDRPIDTLILLADINPSVVMSKLGNQALSNSHFLRIIKIEKLLDHMDNHIVLDWIDEQGVQGAVAISNYLPRPFLNEEGVPIVPELTQKVVQEFENDESFTNQFSKTENVEFGWVGNLVKQADSRIQNANHFVSHPNKAIRTWALNTIEESKRERDHWQRDIDERDI